MEISSIYIGFFGLSAQMYSYGEEKVIAKIITYLIGPIFNIILAYILYFFNQNLEYVYINFWLGILNLFPILPLDGGKAFKEILKKLFGNKKASIFMLEFTKINLIIISLIYSIAILRIKNIAILFLIIYLWWLYSIENRKVQTLRRVYGIIEKSIEKK